MEPTKMKLAQYFAVGYSMQGVARKFRLPSWKVENAVRDVMKSGKIIRQLQPPRGAGR